MVPAETYERMQHQNSDTLGSTTSPYFESKPSQSSTSPTDSSDLGQEAKEAKEAKEETTERKDSELRVLHDENPLSIANVLIGVTPRYRKRVERMLALLNGHITWNSKGEFIHNEHPVLGSHISDLLRDVFAPFKKNITGRKEFRSLLTDLNVPLSILEQTDDSSNKIRGSRKETAAADTSTVKNVKGFRTESTKDVSEAIPSVYKKKWMSFK